jgi:hypothetical protein
MREDQRARAPPPRPAPASSSPSARRPRRLLLATSTSPAQERSPPSTSLFPAVLEPIPRCRVGSKQEAGVEAGGSHGDEVVGIG